MGMSALSARVNKLEQIIQSKIPPEAWLVLQAESAAQREELIAANPDRSIVFIHTVCGRRDCDTCAITGSYACRHKESNNE
jgi:hypothetical protein